MLRAGALILIAALAASASIPSQRPPTNPVASGNQSTSADNRGTNEKPLVVKITTTPKSDKEAADIAESANEQATNDRLLIKLTGALAIAAILQWLAIFWQGILIRRQIKLSEKEFLAANPPRLEVRFVRQVPDVDGIEITVINAGGSAANFVAARAFITHLLMNPGVTLPSPHDIPVAAAFNLRNRFEPSESERFTVTTVADNFAEGFGASPQIFGWIIYDTTGPKPVRRTTYFGRMVDMFHSELVPIAGSDWNFIQ